MNSNLLGEELNNFLDVGATQPELLKIASVIPVSLCPGTCFRLETERNDEVIFRILLSPFLLDQTLSGNRSIYRF